MGSCRNSKLIQACIVGLVTCKNEEDPSKNEGTRVVTTFFSVFGDFSKRSKTANSTVQGLIWPNFKLTRDFMCVLVACKNEEDPIENEGARVVTTLFIYFSDAQGQLTPRSVMESCRNQTHPSFYGWSCYLQE